MLMDKSATSVVIRCCCQPRLLAAPTLLPNQRDEQWFDQGMVGFHTTGANPVRRAGVSDEGEREKLREWRLNSPAGSYAAIREEMGRTRPPARRFSTGQVLTERTLGTDDGDSIRAPTVVVGVDEIGAGTFDKKFPAELFFVGVCRDVVAKSDEFIDPASLVLQRRVVLTRTRRQYAEAGDYPRDRRSDSKGHSALNVAT